MPRMLKTLAAVGVLALASAAAVGAAAADSTAMEPAVHVTRDGERWTADFVLDRDAAVWAFSRSAVIAESRQPWRPRQWSVETPGVILERQGPVDILRTVDGGPVPRRIRIIMRPEAADLDADYDPALIFTDGSVAMFAGHFNLFPVSSLEAARALPADLDDAVIEQETSRVTWSDNAGPVLFQGQRRSDPVSNDASLYVLFGDAGVTESPDLATVIDPQLPAWIKDEVNSFAPSVAGYYARRLGSGMTDRPTVMISWNGPRAGVTSMGGSVLPGLIVMTFEGEGVLERSGEMRALARWFIGHESAHFWLGQTVRYERSRDAWITEGGADLMAIRALAANSDDYDPDGDLQDRVNECAGLADEPVATANVRGESRAYYACGAVFALVAEAAQRRADGGDWFDFLRPLIDASRGDGVLTREEWLLELTRVSGDASLRADIEALLDEGDADAAAVIAGLFDRSGVGYRREEGRIRLEPARASTGGQGDSGEQPAGEGGGGDKFENHQDQEPVLPDKQY